MLALLSSASFGFADFLGGLASRRLQVLTVLVLSQIAGLAGIAILVAVRSEPPPEARFAAFALLAALFATSGLVALYRGLAVGLMSVVAPIAATGAAIPVVATAVTGEAPTELESAGIALALVGIVLVSRADRAPGARLATGAALGIFAAVMFGVFFLAFGEASEDDPYWATFAFRVCSLTLLAAAALVRRPPLRVTAPVGAVLVAIGLLDLAGNAFLAVATTKGYLGVVSVLSSLYPVVTVALARTFLDERLRPSQLAGVAAAFAGVGLIALG